MAGQQSVSGGRATTGAGIATLGGAGGDRTGQEEGAEADPGAGEDAVLGVAVDARIDRGRERGGVRLDREARSRRAPGSVVAATDSAVARSTSGVDPVGEDVLYQRIRGRR